MSTRPLVILPDPQLRRASAEVVKFDAALKALTVDMFETMYDAPGIGLAAIQIGVPLRVVTMDLAKKEDEPQPQIFINPKVVWESEELAGYEEGCLSIPDYYEEVVRPDRVRVTYQTLEGEAKEVEADGLLAVCLQHEIDHLDGVLFIDYLSKLKRDRVIKKFAKQAKRDGGDKPPHESM